MPVTRPKKQKTKTALPTVTATSPPAMVSDINPTPVTPAAPLPASSAVLGKPPNVVVPVPPGGFTPIVFNDYRGFHPKAGQLAAAPDAAQELRDFPTFSAVFGAAVPPAEQLADELDDALAWTQLRVAGEAFLEFVKSGEAVSWKVILTDLDKLDTVAQLVSTVNPTALVGCPALVRMLETPKVIGRRAHATLVRNRADKAKASAAASDARAASATATTAAAPAAPSAPVTNGSGTGGAGH